MNADEAIWQLGQELKVAREEIARLQEAYAKVNAREWRLRDGIREAIAMIAVAGDNDENAENTCNVVSDHLAAPASPPQDYGISPEDLRDRIDAVKQGEGVSHTEAMQSLASPPPATAEPPEEVRTPLVRKVDELIFYARTCTAEGRAETERIRGEILKMTGDSAPLTYPPLESDG